MNVSRRAALSLSLGSLLPSRLARAADFPTKDIRFIIPYGPGGGFDLEVRRIAPVMQANLPSKVQVVPDNIPTGGGVLGISQLYRAKPDGATIAVMNIPGLFVLQRGGTAAFDLEKFSYIGSLGRDLYGIGVAQGSPVKTIADLRALSAQRPVKFTSTGREGTAFSAAVIANHLLGIRATYISGYKGSNDYVVAAIRGDGDAVVTTLPLLRQMQAGGLLRILATFEDKSSVPDTADATSLGQKDLSSIVLERIVAAPPKLPAEIQSILSTALAKALRTPEIAEAAAKQGTLLSILSPDETAALIARQAKFYDTWKTLLDAA